MSEATGGATASAAPASAPAEGSVSVTPSTFVEAAQPVSLKYPEGVNFDPETKGSFEKMVRGEMGHQEFLDAFFARGAALEAEAKKAAEAARVEREKAWEREMDADLEYGGAKLAETVRAASRALLHLSADGALSRRIQELGIAKDPVFLRAFAAIGRGLQEDSIGGTASTFNTPRTENEMLKLMYPSG